MKSHLLMSDPASARQLIAGFYEVENNQWRWARHQFAAVLKMPGTQNGSLLLKFTLPESQIRRLGPVTLAADIGQIALPPETYSAPGQHVYLRTIPHSLMGSTYLPVVFTLDKFLTPEQADGRELAAVVLEISIE